MGGRFITPEEVLQQGANWRRITSAVGRPDTLGEPEWGDGETESSVEGIQEALSMLTGRPEEGFFVCWCISITKNCQWIHVFVVLLPSSPGQRFLRYIEELIELILS